MRVLQWYKQFRKGEQSNDRASQPVSQRTNEWGKQNKKNWEWMVEKNTGQWIAEQVRVWNGKRQGIEWHFKPLWSFLMSYMKRFLWIGTHTLVLCELTTPLASTVNNLALSRMLRTFSSTPNEFKLSLLTNKLINSVKSVVESLRWLIHCQFVGVQIDN